MNDSEVLIVFKLPELFRSYSKRIINIFQLSELMIAADGEFLGLYLKSLKTLFLKSLYRSSFPEVSVKKKVASACNFIKKESLTQVFSYEFCEISKNTFFLQNTSGPFSLESKIKSDIKLNSEHLF